MQCGSDGGRVQIQLLSVEDKLQHTLTEGWEMCLGFQKHSDMLAVLHEAAAGRMLVDLVDLLACGPSSTFSAFRSLGANLSWLGSVAQVQQPNWFACTLVTEQVFKT